MGAPSPQEHGGSRAQSLPAFFPPAFDDLLAAFGAHALEKSVSALTFQDARLKSSFQNSLLPVNVPVCGKADVFKP